MTAATTPTSCAAGLSAEQRAVVEHAPDGAHLLVLAAPGSGKTRVIAERIRWLLDTGAAEPGQVLAMTFTRRAADHLCARIGNDDVWAGTFHAVCVDILQEFGAGAGLRTPIRIADEPRQRDLVERAAASAGWLLPDDDGARDKAVERLQDAISARKLGDAPPAAGPPTPFDDVARWYHAWLDEGGWLDFDDLLLVAARVLLDHPPACTAMAERLRFVFVDEFHDVSAEKYDLVRLIAPPDGPIRVLAVADRDQAIFGWLGARLEALDAFRRDYGVQERRLSRNYRSTPQIVAAARAVLGGPAIEAAAADGHPACSVRCPTPEAEANELARLVGRAIASGRYRARDIAVLYRTHKRGDPAEKALLAAGYAVNREARGRFFAQPGVQDVLRVLDLALAMRDEGFTGALNWPRVTVDEVTMARLRRLAAAAGAPVCDVARRVEDWADRLSPLTRAALGEFRTLVDDRLSPAIDDPIDDVLDRLLPLLAARRDPAPGGDRAGIDDLLGRLDRSLEPAAARLGDAIARRREVAIRTPLPDGPPDADAAAATVILRRLFAGHLGRPLLVLPPGRFAPDGAFTIHLGDHRQPSLMGIGLARRDDASLSAQAWRLAVLLLLSMERDGDDGFVLFDVETGGKDAARTELLEVAAIPFADGQPDLGAGFVSLVRPSGRGAISAQAAKVNGIRWEHVAAAEPPATVVPRLLAAIAGKTLVGHNIERFDLVVLRRVARDLGLEPPRNPAIDTLKLARRLLPNEPSYRLEALARRFHLAALQDHRAEADAVLNADVFRALCGELRRETARSALSEALPLVALGIRAAGIAVRGDAATLAMLGARAHRLGWGRNLIAEWDEATGRAAADSPWLDAVAGDRTPADDAWDRLEASWREAAAAFCHRARDRSLGAFLRHAALAQPVDFVPAALPDGQDETGPDARFVPPSERIAMMTAHSAKGREWPLVFIVGTEDQQFPVWRPNPSPGHDDEERRVLYVAMTRAQRRLVMLRAETDRGYPRNESPFLAPLGDDLLHRASARD